MNGNGTTNVEELLLQVIDAVKGVSLDLEKTKAELVKTREDLGERIVNLGAELAKTREDLGGRIDAVRIDVGGRIDDVKTEVVALKTATASNFERVARTDRRGTEEVDSLRSRIDRIEQHIGLQPTP